jgi:hypothetical protein
MLASTTIPPRSFRSDQTEIMPLPQPTKDSLAMRQQQTQLPAMTDDPKSSPAPKPAPEKPKETGGPAGPEPTRYGDWEQKGRCTDF